MKHLQAERHNHGIQLSVTGLTLLLLSTGLLETFGARPRSLNAGKLNPGDIVYADSGNGLDGGLLVKIDPQTGDQIVLSSGGYLLQPFAPAIDANGAIVVSDTCGRLIQVDPNTGAQTLVIDNSSGALGMPCGIGLDRRGGVVVANTQALVRVDPLTGLVQSISEGGYFVAPIGVAVSGTGELFVLNTGLHKQILRVSPKNGAQKLLTEGGLFNNPQAITVANSGLYVTDVATEDGNFGVGRVVHVDPQSGTQTIVAEGGFLVGPVGISTDDNGQLVVGDPYTVNPLSPDLYDGGIIRIDPATGEQTLLARGQGNHVNPRGTVTVPVLK